MLKTKVLSIKSSLINDSCNNIDTALILNQTSQNIDKLLETIKKYQGNKLNSYILTSSLKPSLSRTKLLLAILQDINLLINKNTNNHIVTNFNLNNNFIIYYCSTIELLHMASQIHSLVESNYQELIKNNIVYKTLANISEEQAILIGDLIFTIAFEQMLKLEDHKVLEYFSSVTQEMATAEANISEYNGSTKQEVLNLIFNKHWALYKAILFFFNELLGLNSVDIEQTIKANLIKNLEKKLINKQLIVPANLNDLLY